jgi:hypothetical protein
MSNVLDQDQTDLNGRYGPDPTQMGPSSSQVILASDEILMPDEML